ncbi:hypothetical protein L7F22_056094 [Adiantum nelumboides]|nr:hypothetical protein [Adiantum nelumboides]
MSTAILTLSEAGQLQKIHDVWLSTEKCASDGSEVDSSQLNLDSFWGLFLITGLASVASLLVYTIRLLCQFSRHSHRTDATSPGRQTLSSRSTKFLKSFASYVDESSIRTADSKGPSTSQTKKKKIEKDNKESNGSQSEKEQNSLQISIVESGQQS